MNEEPEESKTEPEAPKTGCGKEHPCGGSGGCSGKKDNDLGADDGVGRTEFIRAAFAGVTLCWGGVTVLPILSYLTPPLDENAKKAKVKSIQVCKLAELPAGTGKNFRFGSTPALVIHTDDRQLHAFSAVCTHLGCTVQYRADIHRIYCACHGGQYAPDTGKNIAGPPPKPLTVLNVQVVDGNIIVSS